MFENNSGVKKIVILLIGLFFVSITSVFSETYYWVGGTGSWNNPLHWSVSSGGIGGSTVPGASDDVVFDNHSFSAAHQTVMLTSNASCHSVDFSAIDQQVVFASGSNQTLTVTGSYTLSSLLLNGFKGKTIFAGAGTGNSIRTNGVKIRGDWEFNGSGSWLFADDLLTEDNVSILLRKGKLFSNDKQWKIGAFDGNSTQPRTLELGSSEIFVRNTWDCSHPAGLTLHAGTSHIAFYTSVDSNNFRSGGLIYSSVSALAAGCTPSGTPCANFTINLTADSVTCNGLANGAAHAIIVGGSGSFTYDWAGAATPTGDGTPDVSGLGPGSISIKVTDNNTGLFCFCFITIGEPDLLFDYEIFTVSPTCNGLCNGTSGVGVAGGTDPYTFLWSSGLGTNDTAVNVCAGTYLVTVTDMHGCTGSTTIVVTEPAVLDAPGSSSNISCFGACDGNASVSPTGGTTPYVYDWTPGAPSGDGTPSITNLCPGAYACTVTDAQGCTASYSTTITQPAVLTLAMSQTNASCGGVCDGTATGTVSGGTTPYTYVWSNGSSTVSASTTNTISGLCAGSYTLQVTDAHGCVKIDSVTITEPAVLVANATGNNVTCNAACNGTALVVVAGGTPGYSFDWTPGNPTGDGSAAISALCPDTYSVTVTDANGCTATSTAVITEPSPLDPNPVSTNVLCFGACNGTASASPTGGTPGYSYNWIPGNPSGDGTAAISALCPGTYSVIVTDANNCKDTSVAVTITEPPVLDAGQTFTNVTCNGACDGTGNSTPTGGTPPYSYSWSNGASTPGVSGLCPGSYTVTVTDANGCSDQGIIVITQPNLLNVTLNSTSLACNGDCNATAVATVSGGTASYTFDWLPGSPIGDGTSNVSSLCAGSYTVNVVDSHGCPATATISISQPTALTLVSSSSNATCFGLCNGSAAGIVGGGTPGYAYSWAPGIQTTPSISGQCAGSYTLTVTDANGCQVANTVNINQPTQLLGNPTVVSDVSCSGVCNGSATSAPTGGTSPYTYNWSPGTPTGDFTPTITNLCAGNYSLLVTDANSCTSSQTVTVNQPAVLSAPITGSTSSCNICNGTATVTPAGGTAPYTYLWSNGQTTQTATSLCPNTTYTITVTDAHGCVTTNTVTILQTIIISITTSNTTLSCFGACDGIATANASGGTVPYSYLWVDGTGIVSTNQTATSLCAGSYTVTVSDAVGCFNTDTVTFVNPPALAITASSTNASCSGTCDGTASVSAAGGTAPYGYSWVPGAYTTSNVSGLCAGTYTVTVTDASGCFDTLQVVIGEPSVVVDNPVITLANCTFADGAISVSPTGGAGVYSYDWSPGAPTGDGTASITNLLPGAYSVTITSGACSYTFNYLLGNIAGPSLVTAHTNVTCHGSCNGTSSVVASGGAGGYLYDWSPGAPLGDGTAAVNSLCGTTTYTVMVTDAAGCISLDTATVIDPSLISPHPVIANESCGGSCDGSVSLAPTGGTPGYSYSWSTGQTTASVSGLCAGSYTVTITDANGCDSVLVVTISAPPTLVVNLSSTNVLCNSACNGTATATVVGGTGPGTYSYSWTNQAPGIVLPNIVNLCPNEYIVTVTDGNGCTAKDTVDITEPTPLLSSTTQVNTSCFGVCDGQAVVTANGGSLPYGYLWSPVAVANDTITGLCSGSYNVAVTDANGCVSSPPAVVITEPAPIVPTATSVNPTCFGSCNGTAIANPTGGTSPYSYVWSSGGTTQSVAGLCSGAYDVTVTDSLGCTANQTVNLSNPAVLNANGSSTAPTCANSCTGVLNALPSGGTAAYSYSWMPGGQTTSSVAAACPGVYTLIVTDANNCHDTQSVTVVNPLPIDIAIGSSPANCGACDGTISIVPITGTPGYTYFWSPVVVGQGTPNASSVCAGLYDVTVTDANGCDSTFTIPMSNSSGPSGETVSTVDVTCNGSCNGSGSIVPIGGVVPYTYLWNDPAMTANDSASSLCAGNYFVQVTDANGCIHFSPVTINEPAPIIANGSVTNAVCSSVCTGAVTVAPVGGTGAYSYNWTPGAIAGQGTPSASALCPGTYTLAITDANSCVQVDSFVVGQSTPLAATIASNTITCSSVCNGMAYVSITSGTAPYAIQWDDPAGQANDTAFALCAGTYNATITDALGCSISLGVTITATPAISAIPTITDATCGMCDGQAALVPGGGVAPYTYLWSNGLTTSTGSGLCAGLYSVDITDANGCSVNVSVPVNNASGPSSATFASTGISCSGVCDGAVSAVTPVGGVPPYTYLWVASGQTTPAISGLCAGVYYVQITDANGCSRVDSITFSNPSAIVANQSITAATCGACDGSITIAPSGGIAPYTVLWNTGSTSTSLINLCAGVYSVTITDANGCSITQAIPVNSQNGPTLSTSVSGVSCNGSCNGSASVFATGGTSPYAYLWNDAGAQTNDTATGLCAGVYFVQVTGADGCVSAAAVSVSEPSPIGFSVANSNDPLCNGNSNGAITAIPSGGSLPYTYSWSPSGGTAATASGLAANSYVVTVTDANGCSATQTIVLTNPASLTISSVSTPASCNTTPDGSIDVTVGGGTLPYAYQWSGGCSVATTEDISGLLPCTYIITVTDSNSCTIADTTILNSVQSVLANAGPDTSFCQATSLNLNAGGSVNGVNYQWFELSSGTPLGNTIGITVTPPTGTTFYYVVVDNGTGCASSDTVQINSNGLPSVNAGPDQSIVTGGSTLIGGSPTTGTAGSTLIWSPATALSNTGAANPTANPTSTTVYTVTVTSPQGCVASDSMIVTVFPTIVIPNGISPNGDGDNDEWVIDGIDLFPNCTVEVYNRWGELLFQSPGYREHWNGTYKGKLLPVGTYYYVIDLKDPLFPDPYTGPITIMR